MFNFKGFKEQTIFSKTLNQKTIYEIPKHLKPCNDIRNN